MKGSITVLAGFDRTGGRVVQAMVYTGSAAGKKPFDGTVRRKKRLGTEWTIQAAVKAAGCWASLVAVSGGTEKQNDVLERSEGLTGSG